MDYLKKKRSEDKWGSIGVETGQIELKTFANLCKSFEKRTTENSQF